MDLGKMFSILAGVFLLMGLFFNLYPNLPRLPGDINLNRSGLKIYIPVTSAIVISVALTLIFNFLRK